MENQHKRMLVCVGPLWAPASWEGEEQKRQDLGQWSLCSSAAGASLEVLGGLRWGAHGGKSQVRRERSKAGGVVDEAGPLESPPGESTAGSERVGARR